jgi:hypothetical protein
MAGTASSSVNLPILQQPPLSEDIFRVVAVTDLSLTSTATIAPTEEGDDYSFKTILLLSCIGLFASVCLLALGIDFGVDWI